MENLSNSVKCDKCQLNLESPVVLKEQNENNKSILLCEKCRIDVKNEANQSFERFDELLSKIELLLQDPYNFTYELIKYWKDEVQLSGEKEILRIHEKMDRTINRLDEYNIELKQKLKESEYVARFGNLELEKETGRRDLERWIAAAAAMLNTSVKEDDEENWKRIKSESEEAIESFENKFQQFKIDLIPQSFFQFQDEIENDFGKFEVDKNFKFKYKI